MGSRGNPKTGGRKKGTPNKTTTALREAILQAADEAHPEGKVGYLKHLALTNSSAFATLLGKVLPTTITGDKENPLVHQYENAHNRFVGFDNHASAAERAALSNPAPRALVMAFDRDLHVRPRQGRRPASRNAASATA